MSVTALDSQRHLNRRTWKGLQNRGVRAGQPLSCSAVFAAPDQPHATALAQSLRLAGFTGVEAGPHRRGLFKRRGEWDVQGLIRLRSISLEALDDLAGRLLQKALEHQAVFRGLSAERPRNAEADESEEDWE
jgi:hypothetical protein